MAGERLVVGELAERLKRPLADTRTLLAAASFAAPSPLLRALPLADHQHHELQRRVFVWVMARSGAPDVRWRDGDVVDHRSARVRAW